MTLVTLAKLIKRSEQLYEETYNKRGRHTKKTSEAVHQAVEESRAFNDDERKHWEEMVFMLVTDPHTGTPFWKEARDWADKVLDELTPRTCPTSG